NTRQQRRYPLPRRIRQLTTTHHKINYQTGPRAFLYDAETGKPLRGKRVEFTTPDGSEICRAVTRAEGEAACVGPLRLGTASAGTLTNGYVATFRGDEQYGASHAFGTVGLLVRP
ncbi:hypothetical protein ACFZA1_38835, partial [Streptomyces filipinensis]|uniref:hypothetical protein n=1 Tax=Streptomyces filipinensis TaxID=66887 RepID=UPI0036E99C5B